MPATIDRGSGSPRSTESWSSFLALGTAAADSTVPPRSSIRPKPCTFIGAGPAPRGPADPAVLDRRERRAGGLGRRGLRRLRWHDLVEDRLLQLVVEPREQ